jgi:hypothetical protein
LQASAGVDEEGAAGGEDSGVASPDNRPQQHGDELKRTEQKSLVSAAATMSRIKEKKLMGEWMRKERDKRRRKMIVDQSKLQREIEVRKREELVLEKLK